MAVVTAILATPAFAERDDATGPGLVVSPDVYELYRAARANHGDETFRRLNALRNSGQIAGIPPEVLTLVINAILRNGPEDQFDALSYEVTGSAGFAQIPYALRAAFAGHALDHAAKAGDLSRVETLLPYVEQPESYISFLSFRKFESLWPIIEGAAGNNLSTVSENYVRWTADRFAEEPQDRFRFSNAARALLYAGRFEEAVALVRSWRDAHGEIAGLAEGDAWAMNVEAFALDALGRRVEADQVLDQLAALASKDRPNWLVNFVINRASRLVGQERWEEGLAATDLARSVADKDGSTYAKMLVARDRACAFYHLDRAEEAARELRYLRANFDSAPVEATTGLLCAGLEAEAEGRIAQAFADERKWVYFGEALQDPRFELFGTPSALPQARDLILSRENLRLAAFEHVRLLPDRLVPIAYLRRQDIAMAAR